ncbi:MAG: hydantoinase/carbamoylase family amidase, partial [Actinomycetota bacterium]
MTLAPAIDPDRLLTDLRTLRSFGAEGTGVVRPSLSPIDLEARRWLADRFRDAGLEATIDGVGNVFGRSPNPGPAILTGSHSDTQPTGGWLDGAYGVIAGLEAARALLEDPSTSHLAVDVVAWIDEESTYASCLGSRSYAGLLEPAEIDEAVGPDGRTLTQAWADAELDGVPAAREPDRHIGYVEAHIEQGANLERAGNRIGVVTAIVGYRNFRVDVTGQQNHAGTTPMPLRRDAGRGLIEFGHRIDQVFRQLCGERTVWTIGELSVHPGAPSIIPGRGQLNLQFRDPDAATLRAMEAAVPEVAAEVADAVGVDIDVTSTGRAIDPVAMDPDLAEHLSAAAAAAAPDRWLAMPSAAVHDAMFVA